VVLAAGRTVFSGTTRALAGVAAGAPPPGVDAVRSGYRRVLAEARAVAG
jgi:hypothetical protein